MEKEIYLVRHGESEGNVGAIRQTSSSHLTKKGKVQAETIGKRALNLGAEVIVASPMTRAKETAEIINTQIQIPILESELFAERRRPSEQLGTPKTDPKALLSEQKYEEAFVQNQTYKDGEGFSEIHARACNALSYLRELEQKRILVVTHGMFLRVLFATVLLQDKLTPQTCFACMEKLNTTNTGVTKFILNKENIWEVVVWNDHAHFGEY